MLFNGANKYNLVASGRRNNSTIGYNVNYINGTAYLYDNSAYTLKGIEAFYDQKIWEIMPNHSIGFNGDHEEAANGDCGQIGYGVYKLKIYNNGNNTITEPRIDSCLIDFDYYFFNQNFSTPGDLEIYIENDPPPLGKDRFYYRFFIDEEPNNYFVPIFYSDLPPIFSTHRRA